MASKSSESRKSHQGAGNFGGSPPPISTALVTPVQQENSNSHRKEVITPVREKQDQECDDDQNDNEDEEEEIEITTIEGAIDHLLDMCANGQISTEDFQVYMDYIETKSKEGVSEKVILGMVTNPKGLRILTQLAEQQRRNNSNGDQDVARTIGSSKALGMESGEGLQRTSFNNPISSGSKPSAVIPESRRNAESSGEEEWTRFEDEHDSGRSLTRFERQIWQSQMKVKIEVIQQLSKDITSKSANRSFPKFKAADCYGKWTRDLKNELLPIPLCGKRLDLGHLVNPRLKPDPIDELFKLEDGNFDGIGFQNALMLFELLENIKMKVCDFMHLVLTQCMSENADAQEVIRSVKGKDFFILFQQLTKRFEKNKQVQKDLLLQEFKNKTFVDGRGETLRDYFGSLRTIVTELRGVYERDVPDEDLKHKFMEAL